VKIELQPAYVLHSRPYQENNALLEMLTRDHGRLGVVARSSRSALARGRQALQPFDRLLVSLHGRGPGLYSLGSREASGRPVALSGEALACGFYVNELILRFCARADPVGAVFTLYQDVIRHLAENSVPLGRLLRVFEKRLLQQLGFGLVLGRCADSGEPVLAEVNYYYVDEYGPVRTLQAGQQGFRVSGSSLLALELECWEAPAIDRELRKFLHKVIAGHAGDRPFMSRSLLMNTTPGSG